MMRTVVPALAEIEFGVPKNSFMLLTAFVVAFGLVKGTLNFVAGRLSERIGRKKVLLLGWAAALPIPLADLLRQSWNWIVAATVLLGVNQGLTWSMTQTSKLDITRADQRGLTIGLNEFSGYIGLALAGIITAYLATMLGARTGLLVFGLDDHTARASCSPCCGSRTPCPGPGWKQPGTPSAPGAGLKPRYPDQHQRTTDHLGSVHADVVARQAPGRHQPGRPGGEIRRCAGLGVLSGVPLPARAEPAQHRLDRRRLRLRLGRLAILHRQTVRPHRPPQAQRAGACGYAAPAWR